MRGQYTTISMLVSLACVPVGIQAQEGPPQAAIDALLTYAAAEYVDEDHPTLVIDLHAFPDRGHAATAAETLELPTGSRADLYRCDEGLRRCWIEGAERLLRVDRYVFDPEAGVLTVTIFLYTEWEGPGDRAKVFPALRQLQLFNRGGWSVASDEVLVRG